MEEIEKGQKDPNYRLKMLRGPEQGRRTKGPRYTPVSKRQDKPDGIAWILRNHPAISDGAISKLIGTTRTTITAIRDRSHRNIANIVPMRSEEGRVGKECVSTGRARLSQLREKKKHSIPKYQSSNHNLTKH